MNIPLQGLHSLGICLVVLHGYYISSATAVAQDTGGEQNARRLLRKASTVEGGALASADGHVMHIDSMGVHTTALGEGTETGELIEREVQAHGVESTNDQPILSWAKKSAPAQSSPHHVPSPECEPYKGKNIVLVTCDSDFLDFFENWLVHATPFLTSTEQLVVLAEAEDANKRLKEMSVPGVKLPGGFSVIGREDAASMLEDVTTPWGTEGYNVMMKRRPGYLYHFLTKRCTVMFSDVDAVWRADPFHEIDAMGDHSIYLTDDGHQGPSGVPVPAWDPNPEKECNFCGGFTFFKPTPFTLQLVSDWKTEVHSPDRKNQGNQMTLNYLLCKNKLESMKNFAVLPFARFPAGAASDKQTDPVILHANYMAGHDVKVDFLRQRGFWNVSKSK